MVGAGGFEFDLNYPLFVIKSYLLNDQIWYQYYLYLSVQSFYSFSPWIGSRNVVKHRNDMYFLFSVRADCGSNCHRNPCAGGEFKLLRARLFFQIDVSRDGVSSVFSELSAVSGFISLYEFHAVQNSSASPFIISSSSSFDDFSTNP